MAQSKLGASVCTNPALIIAFSPVYDLLLLNWLQEEGSFGALQEALSHLILRPAQLKSFLTEQTVKPSLLVSKMNQFCDAVVSPRSVYP